MKTALEDREAVRGTTVTVPITDSEKNAIRKEASRLGLTMSAYVRMVLSEKLSTKRGH